MTSFEMDDEVDFRAPSAVTAARCYVAGPMRGYEEYNFPAFDECSEWLRSKGWDVISPAEIDRALGLDPSAPLPDWFTIETAMQRDLHEITHPLMTAVVLMPGWVQSEGSLKEVRTAMSCGLDVYFYQPEGHYQEDGWNNEKRLIQVSYPIVELTIKSAEEQSVADEKFYVGEHRVTSSTGGQKGQKDIRYDLIPPHSLEEVAKVYGHGVKKYSANNWKLGYDYSLSLASLERHLKDWHKGEQYDKEGFHHLAAVCFHALTLIYRDKFQPEWDDVHIVT